MFDIADDIPIAGFNSMDKEHNVTLNKVLEICRHADVNLNKDICLFSVYKQNIVWVGDVRMRGDSRSRKCTDADNHAWTDM